MACFDLRRPRTLFLIFMLIGRSRKTNIVVWHAEMI
eukprot:jgi/Antlo1/280/2485